MAAPWEKYATPAAGYGPDPYKVAEEQRKQKASELAQQAADRANNNSEVANANAANAAAIARQRLDMELAAKGLMVGSDGQITARPGGPVGGKPPADPARIAKLNSLIDQINRTQELYAAGPGKTEGVAGIADYLPYDANVQFDTSGAQLSEKGLSAFRIPGSGTMTDRDAAMFERANMPTASTRDIAIEEQLGGIRSRVDAELEALGLPNANWKIGAPQDRDEAPAMPAGNVPAGPRGVDKSTQWLGNAPESQPGGFVPYGQEYRTVDNPELKGVNARINGMLKAGAPAQDIVAYMRSAGVNPDDPEIAAGLNRVMQFRQKNPQYRGGYNVNLDDMTVPMSGFEQARNNIPQTMAGTALATAGNAGGFGLPQMLAGNEGLAYLRQQNPVSAFAGDVGGVIGGTAALGAVGRNTVGRAIPAWLGGGSKAAAGRQLATDATYGGIYGATTEGDPVTGAFLAAGGSAGGQLLGKGIQTFGRGVNAPGAAQLYDNGITPTIGQIGRSRGGILGNTVAGIEDRIAGIPFVGEAVGNARNRGLQQSNIGDLNDALTPIGGKVDDFGTEGFRVADDVVGEAYQNALNPMRLQVDDGLRETMDRVPQYRDIVEQNLDNGVMTGRGFQSAKRIIDGEIASATGTPMGYKTLPPLNALRTGLFDSAERQVPELLADYRLADEAYANLVPIRAATATAENTGGLYTPAQLGRSLRSTDRSVGKRSTARGERPGQDMQTLKQEILPSKVPDSGTVGRGILAAGVGLPVAGGATMSPALGLLALPAAAYTKIGQEAVAKALLAERPKLIRQGAGIFGGRKARKALSGAITAPLLTDY